MAAAGFVWSVDIRDNEGRHLRLTQETGAMQSTNDDQPILSGPSLREKKRSVKKISFELFDF